MATIPKPIAFAVLGAIGIIVAAVVIKSTQSASPGTSSGSGSDRLVAAANANRSARLLALATEAAKAGNFSEAEQRRDEASRNGADRTAVEAVTAVIAAEQSTLAARRASEEEQRRAHQAESDARFEKAIQEDIHLDVRANNVISETLPRWRISFKSYDGNRTTTHVVRAKDGLSAANKASEELNTNSDTAWLWQYWTQLDD